MTLITFWKKTQFQFFGNPQFQDFITVIGSIVDAVITEVTVSSKLPIWHAHSLDWSNELFGKFSQIF